MGISCGGRKGYRMQFSLRQTIPTDGIWHVMVYDQSPKQYLFCSSADATYRGLYVYEYDGATATAITDHVVVGRAFYWSATDGTYIYGGTNEGLAAYSFDGTNLTQIVLQQEVVGATIRGVWCDNGFIYIASGGAAGALGVRVYTFNGTAFTLVSTVVGLASSAYSVFGDGTYIYAAVASAGLSAFSFDGTTLALVDTIDDGGLAGGVVAGGGYIYLANRDDLRAYTFDGTTLVNVGVVDNGAAPNYQGVAYGDNLIFAGNSTEGFEVYTFDGTTFTLVGFVVGGPRWVTPGGEYQNGNLLFSANAGASISVYNAIPEFRGSFSVSPTSGPAPLAVKFTDQVEIF